MKEENYQSVTWDSEERMWYRDGNVGDDDYYDERWGAEQAADAILSENGGGKVYVYNKNGSLMTWFLVEACA